MNIPKIILKRGKEAAVLRFHPWIFSGAIKKKIGKIEEGDLVEIFSFKDELIATGHYQIGSIAVRIIAFKQVEVNQAFWDQKIQQAYDLRQSMGLTNNPDTNVYRLVNAAGDGMPGCIIDVYNETAVIQTHSIGMHLAKPMMTNALRSIYGDQLKAVYDKSAETMPFKAEIRPENGYLWGSNPQSNVKENGHSFFVDWESGQKTGFFIDQRDNRKLLGELAKGRKVLNTFCYSGGFSIYASKMGAELVHSVDSSKKAIDWTRKNYELNFSDQSVEFEAYAEDVFKFFKASDTEYDLVVLDPPAFAKHKKVRHNAIQGYKRLNVMAMERMPKGSLLFTFSCSQVVDKVQFYNTVKAAAIEAKRQVRVLYHLSQPPDHPVSIFHDEGSYLKGLVLVLTD